MNIVKNKLQPIKMCLMPVILLMLAASLNAQHRGDNLSFQGLTFESQSGVKALAMGTAYTAVTGDLGNLFWNPAGLSDIKKLQVSVSANSYTREWWENQYYRPNRLFVTLPFYLDGLYIPRPQDNGMWDHLRAQDSTYTVSDPKLGLDDYSKEAADWVETKSKTVLNNIAAALPFNLAGERFVVSASFGQKPVADFDRNDTYLDPHPGYDAYGLFPKAVGTDTIDMHWYRFLRQRNGVLSNINAALAWDLSENIKVGAGSSYLFGTTEDDMSLTGHGLFQLLKENRFMFWYENSLQSLKGESKFSGMNMNLSAIVKTEHFNIGAKIDLPYTLKREWSYTESKTDTAGLSSARNIAGTDEVKMPLILSVGIAFRPVKNFMVTFDYRNAALSKAEFSLASADTMFRKWTDVGSICFGAEFRAASYLTLLAGYRSMPQSFVPDGAAVKDEGPEAQSFSAGVSLNFSFGRFDAAYELRRLKYYDSYYSNTNYAVETYNNLTVGYTISF